MGGLSESGKRKRSFFIQKSCFRQDIRRSEYFFAAGRSAVLLGVITWLFYESPVAFFFLLPLGVAYFFWWEKGCIKKKEREFLEQFREAITSIAASMRVGYSAENAFREAKKELSVLYPEDTPIQREFTQMVRQIYLQVPMETILEAWASRVRQEDVINFVNVFVMARRSGGNMVAIIRNTTEQIREKLEVYAEIETMLAARVYEFKVMSVIPFVMIAYMKFSFPEFMGILYGNLLGRGVMTLCLFVYIGAYVMGQKIVNIEV